MSRAADVVGEHTQHVTTDLPEGRRLREPRTVVAWMREKWPGHRKG
ncbi:hypothetical protein OG535_37545 [Kitasatospora sp. NBC_00085]